MGLSLCPASVSLTHAVRTPSSVMMSTPVAAKPTVKSWYDSGVRLSKGVVVPTKLDPPKAVAMPEPAKATPNAMTTPEPQTELTGTRPAYLWNPKSLTVDGLPEELKPFKDQFIPEFLTAVPSYLDGKTYKGDNGFDPWGLVALADQKPDKLMN